MEHPTSENTNYNTAIALIGMSGRFPGARNVLEFWQNIAHGVKSIRSFSDTELLEAGVDPALLTQPNYVKAGSPLADIDLFDASFFKFSPREAEIADPQQRVLLECAWEALEDAGYNPETYQDLVGVFTGSAFSAYFLQHVYANTELMNVIGGLQASIGNDKDSLSPTISYKLNLRGPSVSVQTYCSTSLVAVHLACQSLLNYDCDMALAGGVSIDLPQISGYHYTEGGILSPDGECRTFDAHGHGSVMGNGAGIVLLKRMEEALADGDHIYATILGSSVNNDGSVRASYTAPGLSGQSEVIAQALSNANVDAASISYMETHGTATALGDSIELAAMKKAFARNTQKKQFCAIGSVKPNIGHLDRASGVTGLIKASLALNHQQFPPSLNYEHASDDIDIDNSPFYVNTHLQDWQQGETPRRAGVSSFGVGGTNAHVVLEEAPIPEASDSTRPWQLLVLSAKTASALATTTTNLASYLKSHSTEKLADIAYTLQIGRGEFNHRRFVVAQNHAQAIAHLEQASSHPTHTSYQVNRDRTVAFVLPAIHTQHISLAQQLYQEEIAFQEIVNACQIPTLPTKLGRGVTLRAPGSPKHNSLENGAPKHNSLENGTPKHNSSGNGRTQGDAPTQLTLSELFVIDYALAQFFIRCGIQPAALLGEQVGAYVAACIAGIFSVEDALSLLAYQELMENESDGASAANSQAYRTRLATLLLNPPTIPCLSSISGTWISDEQATSLTYWLEAWDQPARFSEGINTLLQDTDSMLLAIGALKDGQQPSERIISFWPEQTETTSATLYNTLGQLWLAGVTITWSNIYTDERRLRLSLPTYPFERQRYWLEAPALQQAKASTPIIATISKKPNKADWFYQPSWERVALSGQRLSAPQSWLIFLDSSGLGQQLAARLQQQGDRVVRVYAGDQFAQPDPYTFSIRPGESDDYHHLCRELAASNQVPLRILHCWSITTPQDIQASNVQTFSAQQESGFYSLLYLAQALAAQYYDKSLQLLVLSTHLQAVHDQEQLAPGKTTILGACKVIPQELLNLTCRNIDVEFPVAGNWEETIEQLIEECAHPASEAVVAYRGTERYVQTYKALSPIGNAAAPVLRQGGVYLITGGLGGIGLTLAEHLARTVQARIVLIGRTALPARADWSDWLTNHAADEATSQKILRLQAIESLGGQVQIYQADIADQAQVQSIVQETRSAFGALHGVFHAAGITDEKAFTAIENTSSEACEAHFQAKVYGTYALAQALQNVPLDFCFLFSSLSTVLGGIGFGAYSAANIFLDAFAHTTNQLTGSKTWISVNWDTWLVKENVQGSFGATVIAFAMTPAEGVEALSYALSSGYTHLVNSTGDLHARMRQWLRSQSPPEERDTSEHTSTHDAAVSLTIGEDYEEKIAEIWQQALGIEQIGLYDNFFDIGGNSLVALEVIAQLKKAFRMPIPAVALFEAPTVNALAKYLRPAPATVSINKQTQELKQRRRQARSATKQADIAIIGMSGRFPGAATVEQFWQNLCEGKESITTFTDEELLAAGVDPEDLSNPDYVKARPVLEQTDQFDANFFGYSPREAELTDPQHRLFLECAWEAMEYAGYNSQTYEGLIGVFGGTNLSFYLIDLLTRAPEAVKTIDGFQISIGNDKDSLTTTVSYKMNLRGPSFAVQTFCSTSLVATHLACQSLLNGECDMAMAGGASIRVPDRVGYTFIEGGQESSDGHCRAFDAHSEGSVLGDGVGVVVLKRLDDALNDGDTIHAVIKGSAINNDGSLKVSYSAPSVVGQADVVTQALDISGISPESISYVETHGTATELGDPIEIASLTRAYRQHTDKIGYCAIGSVKTNVGHLDRAAGVTSLIKTVMALKREQIPASLHYETPNPEIDFANSPFYVNTQLRPWLRTSEHPLRAGINSLGMGGTNVHIVVEQAPQLAPASPSRPWQLLVLSAKTETALQQMTQNLLAYLQTHSDAEFADVAHTLQVGRWLFDHRRMLVCRDRADAIVALQALDTRRVLTLQRNQREQAVAFLLPGVGEQTVGMTWELYQQETTFREAVDRCCAFVKKTFDLDLYTALYPTEIQNAAALETPPQNKRMLFERNSHANTPVSAHLKQTELAQPVLFMLEYALAQLLMQWGLRPQALLGYSLGEYVAACLAGVFSLEDALTLVTRRAQLIQQQTPGVMLAVALSEELIQPYLSAQVNLAVINAPSTCVLSGTATAIALVEQQLQQHEIAHRRVETTHAFHSVLLEPMQAPLTELVRTLTLHAPQIPYLSNVTGDWITAEQATDPSYWAAHMCQTVRFADGVAHLLTDTDYALLEVGPGLALSSFVKQHPACTRERLPAIVATLPGGYDQQTDSASLLTALGKLWMVGVTPDWQGFYSSEQRRHIPLPTYPFERQRYWLAALQRPVRTVSPAANAALIKRKSDIADWFYKLTWQQIPLSSTSITATKSPWLILSDTSGLGTQLVSHLQQQGSPVISVVAAEQFAQIDAHTFQIRPQEATDYRLLCDAIVQQGGALPRRVLHCWSVSDQEHAFDPDTFPIVQEQGFFSLLWLTQALAMHTYDQPLTIFALSTHAQAVLPDDIVEPERAPLLGICKVIPQEPLNITCCSIDLDVPEDGNWSDLALALIEECLHPTTNVVAYRQGQRWIQQHAAVSLPPVPPEQSPFRQQGVYLITGGLGGIGLILAEYLAHNFNARLVLLGRTGLPPRQQWSEWIQTHPEDDALSLKIARLQALEEQGAQILVYQANVADATQLHTIIQEARSLFGALHGVFHAAGITEEYAFQAVQQLERSTCDVHFQAKVYGTYALAQAVEGIDLDFCLLFSSLSAVLGGLGFAAYTASNIFLDAFAQRYNQHAKTPWLTVNWDTWQVKQNAHGALGGTIAAFAMEPAEAIEAMLRVFASGETHLVNSTGDLQARLAQWLRLDSLQRNEQIVPISAPIPNNGDYEQAITAIWQEVLGVQDVGIYENFFDLGGNSLIALEVISKLKKTFRRPISAVALFEAPTISALTRYLQPEPEVVQSSNPLGERRTKARQTVGNQGIALVGMSGRFPGASTTEQFWQNLQAGVESITFFTPEELAAAGIDPGLMQASNYVPARPILAPELVEGFDAHFFGYSPREAELTDPQHRIFLECAWEALEQAGYDSQTYEGLIGIFGGTNISTYLLSADPKDLEGTNNFQILAGNDKDSLTSAVSYKLNLRGPSLTVQTFCSTSLVAVHLACQSLLNGECDLALAGGSSIQVPSVQGHLFEPGGMESPDGHCRTFDAKAKGSMFGDGVGVVTLKRLTDAVEDGDTILAVIKGSAVNNDGSLKVSYAAPSVGGQAEVVQMALANAGVSAEHISYVEAHGTATELGDPIEVASLTKAYRTHTDQVNYCAIGSVKTNIGHLDRAAGASGLIKTVMALKHEQIPASLHYETPNPEIDFEHSPFFVNTHLRPWPRTTTPRRAGVNSLGMGGTNAHVIVEEAPLREPSGPSRPWQLLVLSARTETALEQVKQRLHETLQRDPQTALADIAYTLQVGRRRFERRSVLLCQSADEAQRLLTGQISTLAESRTDRPVAFLFTGVGEHYIGMTQELYQQEPFFRETLDRSCAILQRLMGTNALDVLFADDKDNATRNKQEGQKPDLRALLGRNSHTNGSNGHNGTHPTPEEERLSRTALAQPILFVVEYALAQLLIRWGLQPQAMLGYSLGEYVAACLAGVLSLDDALTLVVQRAQLIQDLPAGSMLAVSLSEDKIQPYLNEHISLAALNSPAISVLAGPVEAIKALATRLERDEIAHRLVKTTHAFHSAMLEPLRAQVTTLARTLTLHAPKIPYISNVTGTWITAQQTTDPAYWAEHMCQTVRFADGIGHLLQETEHVLIEIGPGQSLASFVRQHPDCNRERMSLIVPTLPAANEHQSEQAFLLTTLGKLWQCGVPINWGNFYAQERRHRTQLPTYPFERQRYWLEPRKESVRTLGLPSASPSVQDVMGSLQKEALADWFYVPGWKHAVPLQASSTTERTQQTWLLFMDASGLGQHLVELLQSRGDEVVTVQPGESFAQRDTPDTLEYTLQPEVRDDYAMLLQELHAAGKMPHNIVHLWAVTQEQSTAKHLLDKSFYSLFALAQALGDTDIEHCQITIISNNLQNVIGHETIDPLKATLLGPCRVVPQEYPSLSCRSIDIELPYTGARQEKILLRQLVKELITETSDAIVALRGNQRWVPSFEPMHLEEARKPSAHLQQHGVYLITGGFGGIGLAFAAWLAQEVQARLVLVGRHGLPPREQWPQLLASEQNNPELADRISKVEELEALGAQVLPLQADVSDEAQMRSVIEQTLTNFGPINGVLHTAGLPGIGLTHRKTIEQAAQVLAPKVQGTLMLERVLTGQPLDFLALFSSITSTTGGGPGQIDYCAANAFLDAYAYSRIDGPWTTIALDWGEWQWNAWESGLAGYDPQIQALLRENRQKFGIPFAEGIEALMRTLSAEVPRVVVSTQDFRVIAEQSKHFTASTILQHGRDQQSRTVHPRPDLVGSYVPPRNEAEQTIVAIWEELLGISPIGVNDNFFELGGNSLTGIDLIARLRRGFNLETLASHVLYEAPSISDMVQYIQKDKSNEAIKGRIERGKKRRENVKQRVRETRRTR